MIRIALASVLLVAACTASPEAPPDNMAEQVNTPAEPTADPAGEPEAPLPSEAATKAPPCLLQDGRPVPVNAIRAIGTEPFWGATVEGRCVTYATPEDQNGTRIWTQFSGTAENGRWSGALGGQPFVMTTRPEPGCSDGMSDNRYPIAVTLAVQGEERRGCAKPQ